MNTRFSHKPRAPVGQRDVVALTSRAPDGRCPAVPRLPSEMTSTPKRNCYAWTCRFWDNEKELQTRPGLLAGEGLPW